MAADRSLRWSALAVVPFLAWMALPAQEPAATDLASVVEELAGHGVRLDLKAQRIELEAEICQDREPLEYLLVAGHGADHESLLIVREASAQALNTAILLLGLKQGSNVQYVEKDPPPTREQMEAGESLYQEVPAQGDGFYIYVAWDQVGADGSAEHFVYRAEDLVVNVAEDRTYRRGPWVYLGSRFVRPHKDAEEFFAAEGEGNWISVCYFNPANQLMTGNDPAAGNQYVWYPNMFLMPEIGEKVRLIFSRKRLEISIPAPAAGKAAEAE